MKKIVILAVFLLFIGLLHLNNVGSEKNIITPLSKRNESFVTPLFALRLLQTHHKTLTSFQTHFLHHDQIRIVIPLQNQTALTGSHQNFYTSFHTGSCVHPTQCPCITSGVFCGGKPTCGIYCMELKATNEYQKHLT